jgi:hypothetical protein
VPDLHRDDEVYSRSQHRVKNRRHRRGSRCDLCRGHLLRPCGRRPCGISAPHAARAFARHRRRAIGRVVVADIRSGHDAETPPPPAKIESPPGRPPGRPPGQRPSKHTAPRGVPAADHKAPDVVIPAAQPAENPANLPSPRRKPVRSIDRSNPFAE